MIFMPLPDDEPLMTVSQAIDVIDSTPVEPRIASFRLAECEGLRLAESMTADRDYPPFRKSLMDGYAVRAADIAVGAELKVVDVIAAGQQSQTHLMPGQAMAIMTGAPVPEGADGVVPVEHVAARAPIGSAIKLIQATDARRFISQQGSDCAVGRVVLEKGSLIGPAQIAVAASVGAATLKCFEKPTVAIVGTGDELVDVDQIPGAAQIRDSNTPMLASLLRGLGADLKSVRRSPDDPAAIRSAIEAGMSCDALFVAGGMSMGEFDYVPGLLMEMGLKIRIEKLRIKPGKPFIFAERRAARSTFVFGLPGNPVSAYVCTLRLASRLLSRLAGAMPRERWTACQLEADLPANGSREFYLPAARSEIAGEQLPRVTPLSWKGSADLFTLARADALIVRPIDNGPISRGTVVRILDL